MNPSLRYGQIIHFSIDGIIPDREDVLSSQGIARDRKVPQKIAGLYDDALSLFQKDAEPKGIASEISIPEFSEVFYGNGNNAEDTPVQRIFPLANHLALFAFTLGKSISDAIATLFSCKDYALAVMLDSIASASADKAVSFVEQHSDESVKTLLYSPGYCGWHISGQQQLFQKLAPEKIGISLNNQFLMIPLKSISGVLITGKQEIHAVGTDFPFCGQCKTFSCMDR